MNSNIETSVPLTIVRDFLNPVEIDTKVEIKSSKEICEFVKSLHPNDRSFYEVTCEIKDGYKYAEYLVLLDSLLQLKFGVKKQLTFNGKPVEFFECKYVVKGSSGDVSEFTFLMNDDLVLTEFTHLEKECIQHFYDLIFCRKNTSWNHKTKNQNLNFLSQLYFPEEQQTTNQRLELFLNSPVGLWPKAAKTLLDSNSEKYSFCHDVVVATIKHYISSAEN